MGFPGVPDINISGLINQGVNKGKDAIGDKIQEHKAEEAVKDTHGGKVSDEVMSKELKKLDKNHDGKYSDQEIKLYKELQSKMKQGADGHSATAHHGGTSQAQGQNR